MQSALSVRSWSKNLFSFFGISMPERLKHSHDESYLMCSAQYSMLPEMRSKSILRCEILLWFEHPQGNEERFKMQNFSWFDPGCVHQWIVERLASTNLFSIEASDTSLCDSYLEDWGYCDEYMEYRIISRRPGCGKMLCFWGIGKKVGPL